jgi:hypothetical protein
LLTGSDGGTDSTSGETIALPIGAKSFCAS